MLGGAMLKLDWNPREILLAGSIPALCAAAATFMSIWLRSNVPADQQDAGIAGESAISHG
jgi:hypothetical protein